MAHDLTGLLHLLWSLNDKDDIRQAREAASAPAWEIAALDPATTLATSPMLQARYAFADAWHGAAFGQTWPGLREVATVSALLRERTCHHAHMDVLACTFPEGVEPGRMALFGIDEAKGEATYLVWRTAEAEPVVCAFYGGGLDTFRDLRRYLEFLVGERFHDDSAEMMPGTMAAFRTRSIV